MGYTVGFSVSTSDEVSAVFGDHGFRVNVIHLSRWFPEIGGSPGEAIEEAEKMLLAEFGEDIILDTIEVCRENWAEKPFPRDSGTWYRKSDLEKGLKSVMVDGNRYEQQPLDARGL